VLLSPGSLLVTFSRQGENEEVQIALTGEKALTAALVMLILRDELRPGDCLTVRQNELVNLFEQGRR
jgi:hypothetical protein